MAARHPKLASGLPRRGTSWDANAAALSAIPTWLFSSGPLGDPLKPLRGARRQHREVLAATGARAHLLFAGALDKDKLGFGERAVVTAVRAVEGTTATGWAGEIAAALTDPQTFNRG
jgi:menaquinone-dependent protoporphyrinogen oxidase